jgi:hypothetical protein
VRRALVCALIACGLAACRYDYEALMGAGRDGSAGMAGTGASPGTGGDVAIGGRGGAAGSVAGIAGRGGGDGGDGGNINDGRGGAGPAGRGGGGGSAGGSGARGGEGGSATGGSAGSAGSAGTTGRGGASGGAGASGGTTGGAGASGGAGAGGRGGAAGAGGMAGVGGRAGAGGGGLESDLVLWYKFDEGTGAIATDSSTAAGAPHDGTFAAVGTGAATFSTTHQVGTGALSLTGTTSTSDENINVPASLNALGATTTITIACWINLTTDRAWARVWDFNNSSTTGYMFLTTYQTQSTPNTVRFAITTTTNTAEQQISGTARLTTGAWHHVAVVLDAGATYTGTLYVDGAVAGTNPAMTLRPSSLGNTVNNWIGRSAYTQDPYFAGLIDDFRVYSRALSPGEITTLFTTVR